MALSIPILAGTISPAATRYVSPNGLEIAPYASWDNASRKIQLAVTASSAGDTVLVSNGTYVLTNSVTITNGITVRSVNGAAVTLVDGNGAVRGFTIKHTNAVVEGFTITNGYVYGTSGFITSEANKGGGVYMTGGLLKDCVVVGNVATGQYNKAGGVFCYQGGTVENCTISQNRTLGTVNASGGGLYCYQGGTAKNCTLIENSAVYSGAGAFLDGGGTIQDSTIISNSVVSSGGGLYVSGGTVLRCVISRNKVTASGEGGGIYVSTVSTVRNCLITGNSSANNSGGVRLRGGAALENCTVVGNSTVVVGSGIYADSGTRIINCIVWSNNPSISWGAAVANVSGGLCSNSCTFPLPSGAMNTITTSPMFVSGGYGYGPTNFVAGNYRLLSGSPSINTGTNQGWMAGATDIEGNPRIFDDYRVDMGAYEAGDGLDFGSLMSVPGADGGGVSASFWIGRDEVSATIYAGFLNSAELHGTVEVTSGEARRVGTSELYALTQTAESRADIQYNPAGVLGSRFTAVTGRGEHPVTYVTWIGAAAFCNWRSGRSSLSSIYEPTNGWTAVLGNSGYRLPSEQEWQKAAAWDKNASSYKAYGTGSNALNAADANYLGSGDSYETNGVATCPVGAYATTSPYGLKDAAGNVWEWCQDFYQSSGSSPATDPHAARGGGYGNLPMDLRADNRIGFKPGDAMNSVGFRVMTTNNPNP
jgi:formylglycine-generating enzyme required for sulfatase activity